jgi:tetratricopeptide (TPR) repeat protein
MMAQQSILQKYQVTLICVVLILLVITAFEPVRHNDFVDYDDKTYILLNQHIHDGITWDSVKWAFTSGYAGNWHPQTWLSHMLDIDLFKLNPVGHHLHNLALHIASVVLLFLILRSLTGSLWRCALAAAIFGVHPLRVESVAWAAERKDVLCALFWMLTTAAYIGYARRGGVLRYLLVIMCFGLGLMAKPMIVTLPLVFLLLDIWPLARVPNLLSENILSAVAPSRPAPIGRLIVEKIPLLLLVAVSCLVTYKVQSSSGAVDALDVTWTERIANGLISYVNYIVKIIWPINLAALYPFPEQGYPLWKPAAAFLLLSGWTVWTVRRVRKWPWLFVGWFWYLVTLIPVIGLVQIGNHAMADRYSYLPCVGILLMLVWTVFQCSARWKIPRIVYAVLCAGVIPALIMTTRIQAAYWKNSLTLNEHTLAVTENNYVVYNNMGAALLVEKRYDESLDYLRKALEIRPDYYLANTNMALTLKDLGQYDQAQVYANAAIKKEPYWGLAYFIRGRTLVAMGRDDDALAAYKQAAKLDSEDFRFFYDAGLLLAKKGAFQEAIHYFKETIRCYPAWGDAWRDMGLAQQRLGLIEDALASYRMALKLISRDYVTCYRTAVCFEQIGHPRDAIYFYRQAITFKPDFSQAIDKLAWLLATSPVAEVRNPSEAVLLAQKANQIAEYKNYWLLDTLAAAYAAGGRFKEAVETLQKAIKLAQTTNDAAAVEVFTTRLQLYQENLPYLEPAVEDVPK